MSVASVTCLEHLLVLIPYLLGYRPTDALVLVGLRGARLGLVERVDWPGPWGDYDDRSVIHLAELLFRDGCDATYLVAYEDRDRRRWPALDQVAAALDAVEIDVLDRLVVTGRDRWRSLLCEAACCAGDGRPLPAATEVPTVAEWVLRGVVPYPDRAAFAASVEPTAQLVGYDFAGLRPLRPTRASAQRAWRTVLGLHGDTPVANLDAMTAWQAAGAAAVPALRDEVLNLVCPGFSSGQIGPGLARGPYDVLGQGAAVQDYLRRMVDFARRLPETRRADTLAMIAACAWWHGHGTLARICLDRARQIDPAQSLAAIVGELLDQGVRPGPVSGPASGRSSA